mmetsp:Transcript_21096/g.68009  ORF Transcript_21096/g.68009 Transcript_21096/m.68009 type:complete len:217 (+) Transcript_21096:2514-3164(+)
MDVSRIITSSSARRSMYGSRTLRKHRGATVVLQQERAAWLVTRVQIPRFPCATSAPSLAIAPSLSATSDVGRRSRWKLRASLRNVLARARSSFKQTCGTVSGSPPSLRSCLRCRPSARPPTANATPTTWSSQVEGSTQPRDPSLARSLGAKGRFAAVWGPWSGAIRRTLTRTPLLSTRRKPRTAGADSRASQARSSSVDWWWRSTRSPWARNRAIN